MNTGSNVSVYNSAFNLSIGAVYSPLANPFQSRAEILELRQVAHKMLPVLPLITGTHGAEVHRPTCFHNREDHVRGFQPAAYNDIGVDAESSTI